MADEGRLAFVGSLFRSSPSQPTVGGAVAAHSTAIARTLLAALHGPHRALRSAACDVLSAPLFPAFQAGAADFDALEEAVRLAGVEEADGGVRAAASRALGFLVKSPAFPAEVKRLKAEQVEKSAGGLTRAPCAGCLSARASGRPPGRAVWGFGAWAVGRELGGGELLRRVELAVSVTITVVKPLTGCADT